MVAGFSRAVDVDRKAEHEAWRILFRRRARSRPSQLYCSCCCNGAVQTRSRPEGDEVSSSATPCSKRTFVNASGGRLEGVSSLRPPGGTLEGGRFRGFAPYFCERPDSGDELAPSARARVSPQPFDGKRCNFPAPISITSPGPSWVR